MPEGRSRRDGEQSPTGPKPDSLKIDLPWEEAVRRAMSVPVPPGGVPARETQKRKRRTEPKG